MHFENLTQNRKKIDIRIFPDFPDPVFFPGKKLRRLAHGQTLRHLMVYKSLFHILLSLATWQKLADMKNAKNLLFWNNIHFIKKRI